MKLEDLSRKELLEELKRLRASEAEDRSRSDERELLLHELRVHQVELELQNRELREKQSTLEASQARFEDLYDFAPVAYFTFDQAGAIREVNLTGAAMLGKERSRLIGVPFLTLVDMPQPALFREHLARAFSTGSPVTTDMTFSIRPAGSQTFQVISAPARDLSGNIVAARTAFTNVSELRALGESLERARAKETLLRKRFQLLDAFAVSLNSRLGRGEEAPDELLQEIVDQARAACDAEYAALGIGTDPRRPFTRWVVSGIDPAVGKAIGRIPRPVGILGEVIHTGRSLRLRDLREYPLFQGFPAHHPAMRSFLGMAIPDGGTPVGHLYLANKRSAEEFSEDDQTTIEMMALRAGLILEIARLSREAREAVRAREDILAMVSHDLRSPLTAVLVSAGLLLAPPEADGPTTRKNAQLIQRSSARMKRLIDDLLQAATIESGHLAVEPGPEPVAPIVDQAVEILEPQAGEYSVRIEKRVPEGLPRVRADRDRIVQVLVNLLGNALKFARNAVEVRAWAQGTEVRFAVTDDGPGIERELIPELFRRYRRGARKGGEGAGLGLYICKGIVDAHDGRIWAESEPGRGTTVTFTLPIASAGGASR